MGATVGARVALCDSGYELSVEKLSSVTVNPGYVKTASKFGQSGRLGKTVSARRILSSGKHEIDRLFHDIKSPIQLLVRHHQWGKQSQDLAVGSRGEN